MSTRTLSTLVLDPKATPTCADRPERPHRFCLCDPSSSAVEIDLGGQPRVLYGRFRNSAPHRASRFPERGIGRFRHDDRLIPPPVGWPGRP